MSTFSGRLFAPGVDGAGVAATGKWLQGQLRVQAADREWTAHNLTLAASGFNAAQLCVAWQVDGGGAPTGLGGVSGECRFFVDAGVSLVAFSTGLPPHLASAHGLAQKAQRSVARRFRMGWLGLGLLALVPVLVLALLVIRLDAVVNWAISYIPTAQEARLGDLVLAQTRAHMRVIDQGPAVDAVTAIGAKLTPDSPYHYRWLVVDAPEINAFAAPGGVVVVNSGLLLAADTAEEAAGVIAHEVAHAELRHGLQGMVKRVGLRVGVAVVLGDWSGALAQQAATSLLEMKFSREAETAADTEGLRFLVAAKIDPRGMVQFMEKLDAKGSGSAGRKERRQEDGQRGAESEGEGDVAAPNAGTALTLPAFLSTHPQSAQRAADLRQAVLATSGPWQALSINWVTVKQSLPKAAGR